MTQQDPTLSRNVLELVTIAGEYCSFIENAHVHSSDDLFRSMRSLVTLLYLRGSLISDIEPQHPETYERYVTQEEWDGIFTSLRDVIGNDDEFSYAAENDYDEQTLLKGSISEHFADVYQDMKDFVLLFKKPSLAARENAIHECKMLFDEHWGQRLANLLPVIHALTLRSRTDSTENDDYPGIF